jgi:AcrR family transcriptional regulator
MADEPRAARRRILDTSAQLFYRDGFRAVGIDTIIAQSGVAKMTLYRHFPSKDDLITAYLEESNRRFWDWLEGAIAPHAGAPRDQLLALFDSVGTLATCSACLGCTFQGAAAEFPDLEHPGHRAALAHKQAVLMRLRALAEQAGAHDPAVLAEELLLLMDGAFVASRMFGRPSPARHVARAAATLIAAQIGPPSSESATR